MKRSPALLALLCCAAPLAANDWTPLQPLTKIQFQSSVAHVEWTRPPKPKALGPATQTRTPEQIASEATAIALRLGRSSDSTYEADPAAVQEFVGILNDLRARYPEIADLPVGRPTSTGLLVILNPQALASVLQAFPIAQGQIAREVKTTTIGLQDLDLAIASLHANYILTVYNYGMAWLLVDLHRPLDTAKIVASLKTLPSVKDAGSSAMYLVGAGESKVQLASDGTYTITLVNGWGDCMAGCAYREKWIFEARGGQTAWKSYTGYGFDTVNKKLVPVEAEPPSTPRP